jgi:hypothetical protein
LKPAAIERTFPSRSMITFVGKWETANAFRTAPSASIRIG